MIDRVAISTALFAKLTTGITFNAAVNGRTTWSTSSQRLKLWGKVAPDQQPSIFLAQHRETDDYRHIGTPRRKLEYQAWCYARTDSDSEIGATYVDTMLKAIEDSLAVDDFMKNSCTLGHIVDWCRIEGRILKDPGDIDSQALLLVPIVVQGP